ncbi:hypothetical protein QJQ45_027357, partial [Haematococcus lacustris]
NELKVRAMALELLFGSPKSGPAEIWQDREIRFDTSPSDLDLCKGEDVIQCIVGGSSEALFVSAKYHSQRFEFIFTSLATNASQLFSVVQAVNTAYNTSRLYRELKLRGALIADRELRLLPQEQTYSRVNGVWNLSSEQGNLGTFFISNVRVVWYANLADSFNVSIPYLQEVLGVWNVVQMKSIKLRDSKFGTALVIETTPWSGGYMLGFKVDPKETLDYVHKELSSLWATYSQRPIFGVEADLSPDLPTPDMAALRITSQVVLPGSASREEDVTIVEASDKGDVLAAYYADPTKGVDREPVFCPELGLAVEALKEGLTVEQLWSVL